MRYRRIPDNDGLFRHCIHPHSFRNRGKRFASDKLIYLKYDENKQTLLGSLAWERYVPTTRYVHDYGCQVASFMNEKLHAEGKSGKERFIYCGAYQLNGIAVRALAATEKLNEISSADVVHHIENEQIAHTDLRISLRLGNFDVENTKTAIVDRLWNACSGPLKYIDDRDKDIKPHPSSDLYTPPAGVYTDTRSYTYRLLSVIRFRIYKWFWCNFCQNAPKQLVA
jgi:hypothetical protein